MTERLHLSLSPHRRPACCKSLQIHNPLWLTHLRVPCPTPLPVPLKPRQHITRVSSVIAAIITQEHIDEVGRAFRVTAVCPVHCPRSPGQGSRCGITTGRPSFAYRLYKFAHMVFFRARPLLRSCIAACGCLIPRRSSSFLLSCWLACGIHPFALVGAHFVNSLQGTQLTIALDRAWCGRI
jgi:hypothetical protein